MAGRQLVALLGKELLQLIRDRALFGYVVYIFTLNIVINAASASTELRHTPVLVRDADRSALSRELARGLREPYFKVESSSESDESVSRRLDRGDVRLALELPSGLERRVGEAREPARVQALVDSSKAISGYLTSSYAARITETLNRDLILQRLAQRGVDPRTLPRVENERRTLYNFAGDERWSSAISMLLTMMTVACVLLPAAALVREKERGTAEQLLVSPLSPLQILVPKVLAMVLVSLVGTAVSVFLIMGPLFSVPCRGSPALFLTLTAIYAFANAGLGVVLGTFSRTTAQVGLLVMLTVMPLVQLSGTWGAVESMPSVLRYGMLVSPLRHFIVITYGVLLKGVGLEVLWPQALAIAGLGLLLFGAAAARFRGQFAVQ
jgi:ABC-2 type transport system permease protein